MTGTDRHDVVVVGAGLAGLRVATLLAAAGRDVVVVESRDRVGGRIWSHHFSDGQWCERGAEFIDADHHRVLGLARDLGLTVLDRGPAPDPRLQLLDVGGHASPLAAHPDALSALRAYDLAVLALPRPWEIDLEAWPPDAPVADLAEASPAGRYAATHVRRAIRNEWMVPPAELGQLAIASARPLTGRERHRIAGGNDQLVTGMRGRLAPGTVRLATPVRHLDADAGAVHLASGEVLHGDAVVATVSLPVLGRIWPGAPRALTAIGYGLGGKVSVQFSRRLWRDYGRDGSVFSDRVWGQIWDTTDVQPGDGGVLTALLSSHDGVAQLAIGGHRERLLAEIDRIFPGCRGLAGESVATDWANDPWSLGCYSSPGPGQLAAAWPHLRRPHGRLWLAGEYADQEALGFMEGALASAERVAGEIGGGAGPR